MTLGDIFKGANISFPAGEQMLQKIRSKGNFKEVRNKQLEKDLNDLIYGTDLSVETEYAKSINSIGESYIQEVLNLRQYSIHYLKLLKYCRDYDSV